MANTDFDFIIHGSGAVGSALALALAQKKYRVALIDRLSPSQRENIEDNRVFALSHQSKKILETLELWPLLASQATAIAHIHVSNQGSFGAARLHAKDFDCEALGYMLASRALTNALHKKIATTNITQLTPMTLTSFTTSGEIIDVHLKHEDTEAISHHQAHYLIGADGIDSIVRQQAGIGITKKDYQQKAIVCVIDLDNSHHFTAYERFVGDTVIALLPHTPWQSVLIWSGDNASMETLMALDDTAFLHQLQQAFGYRLGKWMGVSKRMIYPLMQATADQICAERILLMGNAAHVLHPVGAQGLNLALRHLALFTHLLQEAHSDHRRFTQDLLTRYARAQQDDTKTTMRFTHHLVHFSSMTGPLNRLGRSLIINALGSCTAAQKYLLFKEIA